MPILNSIAKHQLSVFKCGICGAPAAINETFIKIHLRVGIGLANLMVDCKNCGCTSYLNKPEALPLINSYFQYINPEIKDTLTLDNCINVLSTYIAFTKVLEG